MGEIIMITSGKGGVGKTTATALMGVQLSRLDKRVVMIDMDFGLIKLIQEEYRADIGRERSSYQVTAKCCVLYHTDPKYE